MTIEIPLGLDRKPPRRNLAPLREVLAGLKQGDVVKATIHKGVYGTFTLTGAVRRTLTDTQWVLASWHLNTGDKPADGLLALEVVHPADGPVPAEPVTAETVGPE